MLAPPEPAVPAASGTRFRRSLRVSGGFLLLLAGIPLLVLPGPGAPAIFLGLNLLAVDFPWARRLLGRLKSGTDELQRQFFKRSTHLNRARGLASDWSRRLVRRSPQPPLAPPSPPKTGRTPELPPEP